MGNALADVVDQKKGYVLTGMVLIMLVSAAVEVYAVKSAGAMDWYMHLAMWIVLCAYGFLATRGFIRARKAATWTNLVLFAILSIFWITVMYSSIPESVAVAEGQLIVRESLEILWLPIVLLSILVVGLVLSAVAVLTSSKNKSVKPEDKPAKPEDKPTEEDKPEEDNPTKDKPATDS